jgi:membrane protein implicated in regulation of membrane protease activity
MLWVFYVYLGIGIFGFILLMISLIFSSLASIDLDIHLPFDIGDVDVDGGDADVGGGHGPGPFSLPVMMGFLTTFGALGAILTYYDVSQAITPFVSVAAAILVSFLLYAAVAYMFHHFQADSTVSFKELVGSEATVSVSIRGGREGQVVLFTDKRGRTLVPAIADEDIPENTKVTIEEVLGDTVRVSRRGRKAPSGRVVSKRR